MPNGGRPSILVVEDERAIADTVVYALRTEGFAPAWCPTAGEARTALARELPALVVLDVGLPDANGFEFFRELRATYPDLPVIFLTARSEVVDRIVGLEIGGDDYLTKPFSPRELTARVKAVLRRRAPGANGRAAHGTPGGKNGPAAPGTPPAEQVTYCVTYSDGPAAEKGPWKVDAARCRISYRGTALDLTATEFRLLRTLVEHSGRVFTRDQLLESAWSDPGASTDRTVDAHVKTLRGKLRAVASGADPIQTHRGLGYSLREETIREGTAQKETK